jgi:NADH dehydrogenase (ubiquinone) 1 alpha subcomplex subunit 10
MWQLDCVFISLNFSGKSDVAKKLAEELDMLYMPDATLDDHYINSYGYDMRKLNKELPESCRSFDLVDFHKSPAHKRSGVMQCIMYKMRYLRYVDALGHMLSTGQGVVLDRCCYSDIAFAEAMFKNNYMSKIGLISPPA